MSIEERFRRTRDIWLSIRALALRVGFVEWWELPR